MSSLRHWVVGLDLTNMDDIVLRYIKFLSKIDNPEKISFMHIVETPALGDKINELFPELDDSASLENIISQELNERVERHFKNTSIDIEILIEKGSPTETLLASLDKHDPDLLILGKKTGYKGEGILARKIAKLSHCSILFVAENSHYQLNNILVPVRFGKASARAIKFAVDLSMRVDADVKTQHVYKYPTQFFPYIASSQYAERMNQHLNEKYESFKEEYDLGHWAPPIIFTVSEDGKEADQIYDQSLKQQADLIVVGSKSKTSAAALLTEELADELADYNFGIPLLIYKEKEEHLGLLKSLLEGE